MIAGLKPYPKMKDSGVEWLGQVPKHWEIKPLSRIGWLFKGNGGSKDDEVADGIPCVRYGDLYTQHEHFIRCTKGCISPKRADDYTPIRYGDVLFAASGETIDDIGKSAVNLLREVACCGGDILVLRPTVEVVPEFLGYSSNSPASKAQKACVGRGFTVVHIYGSQLKRLALPLPPLPEQTAIVRFLDYVERRIRRYIRAKQKLIKLLEEYKQALIHQAVTGRMDVRTSKPYPEYKDSGVEWLGQVPAHWEVRRNAQLFVQRNETGFAQLPILEVSLRTGVRIRDLADGARKQVMSEREGYKRVRQGEVAYNMMRMWQGAVGIAPVDGLVSPAYIVAAPRSGVNAHYYVRLFTIPDYKSEIDRCSRGIVKDRNRLYWEDFKSMSSPYPPLPEQTAIVEYLDEQIAKIDRAGSAARREIELLEEYRTRLIADVVTGKLDVRNVKLEEGSVNDEGDEADWFTGEENSEMEGSQDGDYEGT